MQVRLILLHAFPLDARMWDDQLQIVPGRTEAPTLYPLGDSLETWATAVLNSVGNGPLVVVGSSMGGSCALEMARQAPDKIAALVLVGAKAGHRPEPALRDRLIASLATDGISSLWAELVSDLVGSQAERSVIDRVKEIMLDQRTEDLIRAIKIFHGRPDLAYVVSGWEKPLIAVCGDCDQIVTEKKTADLASRAPLGQLYVMRGCAHYMNMERPWEFNQIIGNLVRSVENN